MSLKSEIRTDEFHIFGDDSLREYIKNRIRQLRHSKYIICNQNSNVGGSTKILAELNCRLSELEHIATEFGFINKIDSFEEDFE